jgi:hypothetical protein
MGINDTGVQFGHSEKRTQLPWRLLTSAITGVKTQSAEVVAPALGDSTQTSLWDSFAARLPPQPIPGRTTLQPPKNPVEVSKILKSRLKREEGNFLISRFESGLDMTDAGAV